jgi:hypothetical protein
VPHGTTIASLFILVDPQSSPVVVDIVAATRP